MQVVNESAQLLTNAEVYQLLDGIRSSSKGRRGQQSRSLKNLATLSHTAHKFLTEQTPAPTQSPESVAAFLAGAAELQLSRQEALQLVNLCPRTPVEVHVVVDDCDERLTDAQVQQLLDLVEQLFPAHQQQQSQYKAVL